MLIGRPYSPPDSEADDVQAVPLVLTPFIIAGLFVDARGRIVCSAALRFETSLKMDFATGGEEREVCVLAQPLLPKLDIGGAMMLLLAESKW